jgi:hypothetical protein
MDDYDLKDSDNSMLVIIPTKQTSANKKMRAKAENGGFMPKQKVPSNLVANIGDSIKAIKES